MICNLVGSQSLEAVALTAGEYGCGHLVELGGCEYKGQMLGRLLENFQQCVERGSREHVHLIDDIHALFDGNRGKHRFLAELTDIVNTVIGSRVNLNNVENTAVVNAQTCGALAAGVSVFGVLAVQRLGENFRAGGLQ